jgi:hypothetical protein
MGWGWRLNRNSGRIRRPDEAGRQGFSIVFIAGGFYHVFKQLCGLSGNQTKVSSHKT